MRVFRRLSGCTKQNAQTRDAAFGFGEFGKIDGVDLETAFANHATSLRMVGGNKYTVANQRHVCCPRFRLGNGNQLESRKSRTSNQAGLISRLWSGKAVQAVLRCKHWSTGASTIWYP